MSGFGSQDRRRYRQLLAGLEEVCAMPRGATIEMAADGLAGWLSVAECGLMAMRRAAEKEPGCAWAEEGLVDRAAVVVGFLRNLKRLLELGEIRPDCALELPAGTISLFYHTCLIPAVMLDREIAAGFRKTLADACGDTA